MTNTVMHDKESKHKGARKHFNTVRPHTLTPICHSKRKLSANGERVLLKAAIHLQPREREAPKLEGEREENDSS